MHRISNRPNSLNQLIETIEMIKNHNVLPIKLIVLDTLARGFGGTDENTAKDMGHSFKVVTY